MEWHGPEWYDNPTAYLADELGETTKNHRELLALAGMKELPAFLFKDILALHKEVESPFKKATSSYQGQFDFGPVHTPDAVTAVQKQLDKEGLKIVKATQQKDWGYTRELGNVTARSAHQTIVAKHPKEKHCRIHDKRGFGNDRVGNDWSTIRVEPFSSGTSYYYRVTKCP
ncbi:MAG: hypothetical protein SFX73_03285 [Kofleriaceae bacterium]|nr:hypothetical protein [Kofleriaceae bacterium]